MRKLHRNLKNGKDKIKRALNNTSSELREKVKDMRHGVVAYARKNPLKTVGFSLLAGMLISSLRRLRK